MEAFYSISEEDREVLKGAAQDILDLVERDDGRGDPVDIAAALRDIAGQVNGVSSDLDECS